MYGCGFWYVMECDRILRQCKNREIVGLICPLALLLVFAQNKLGLEMFLDL